MHKSFDKSLANYYLFGFYNDEIMYEKGNKPNSMYIHLLRCIYKWLCPSTNEIIIKI